MQFSFDLVGTIACASVVLWVGIILRRKVAFLGKYNIPAPVIGGILFALLNWAIKDSVSFSFDMTLKSPLMIAFFTTVGLGASVKLLKKGGPQVALFLGIASILLFFQNLVAFGISKLTGFDPLLGLLAGSITMSGGHGTGATFAQSFIADFGLNGAMEVAMAAATFGLVAGSIIGGPIAKRLIEKKGLSSERAEKLVGEVAQAEGINEVLDSPRGITTNDVLGAILQISVAMSLGALAYNWLLVQGIKLPTYLCALFVGIVIRNVSDFTGVYRVNLKIIDFIGSVSLSLFLAMALMSLKLWQLADLAGPMAAILLGETVLMGIFAYFVTFKVMSSDYDAAVMAGGHCGFGMGATPNAVANMEAITYNYGPAPRAFFVVPMVGAFFIDISNAFLIQIFVNYLS